MSKQDELKALNAKKKAINEEQKAIREELNKTKGERTAARKEQAACRKSAQEHKAELRDLSAKVYKVFSAGDSEAINQLADDIMEVASELSGTIRKFGTSASSLEDL